MNKNSISKNYVYNFIYQISLFLFPLILTPYLSRVLGANGIGEYSYTQSIITYFILFGTLGINMYAQREIAYVQDDTEKRSKIFLEIAILKFITVSISLIIFYFFILSISRYKLLFLIQIIDIVAAMIDVSWFFQGMEEFKKTVTRNILVKIFGIILIFTFVRKADDLLIYVLCLSVTSLLGNMLLWLYLPKYIRWIKLSTLKFYEHLKPTLLLFIPQIASQIYTVLDKTMIGLITQIVSEVGYYEQSQKIIRITLAVVTSLGIVMMPRMANSFAKKDIRQVQIYMANSFKFVFFLSFPIMFGLMGISKNFVPWFFGNGYNKVICIMIIMSPIIVAIGLSNVIGVQYLLPTKRQAQYTISVIAGAIINFFINIILIPRYMSIGAAIATVIAECLITIIQFYFVRNDIKIIDTLKSGIRYFICAFIMFLSVFFLGEILNSNIVATAIQIIIGGIIYLLILIALKDIIVVKFIEKLKNKFKI